MGAAGFPLRLLPFLTFAIRGRSFPGQRKRDPLGGAAASGTGRNRAGAGSRPLLGGAEGQSTAAAVFAADVSEKFSFPGRQNLTGMHPEDFCKIGLNLFCTIGAEKSDSGEKRPLSR